MRLPFTKCTFLLLSWCKIVSACYHVVFARYLALPVPGQKIQTRWLEYRARRKKTGSSFSLLNSCTYFSYFKTNKVTMKVVAPFLILSTLLFSCINQERLKPENFAEREVVLKDLFEDTAFYKVNLFVPMELDTLLEWVDNSDCPCCEVKKYRLTSSKGCLIQESGFFKPEYCRDSFQRLTVEHSCFGKDNLRIDTAFLSRNVRRENQRNKESQYPEIEWRQQEIKNINGHLFAIFHYVGRNPYLEKPFEQIVAVTNFRNTVLDFRFECYRQDCIDFSEKAFKTINSIMIGSK